MNKKGFCKRAGFSAIIVALTGLTALAVPTNGDFSISDPTNPNFGWTIYPEGSVFVDEGKAIFKEIDFPSGTLSQEFTMPALAQWLSFDFKYSLSEGTDETDVFTASLLNPITMESLTENLTFFYWDSTGLVLTDPTEVTILTGEPNTMTITLTLLPSYDSNVLLRFAFLADEEEPDTSVSLDNVSVSIPAPGAVVLGFIGTGAVGLWRRFSRGI
jgi:hypothetical protein